MPNSPLNPFLREPVMHDIPSEVSPDILDGLQNALRCAIHKETQSFKDMLSTSLADNVKDKISNEVYKAIDDYIKENYGTINRKTNVYVNDKQVVKNSEMPYHKEFEKVVDCLLLDIPVYLYGESGTGKNVLAQQVAKSLSLEFYYTNSITDEFQLKGFTDANGRYQESEFYKAFVNGGVFMLDELDASVPEALIILNSAIANKYFDFPAPIGKKYANDNFRIITAGNTLGRGADSKYIARNMIDIASLDRFFYINIDYDRDIEFYLCHDYTLIDFVEGIRKILKKQQIAQVITYRSISLYSKLLESKVYDNDVKLLRDTIFKNFSSNDLKLIQMGLIELEQNKYTDEFRNMMRIYDE